MSTTSLARRRRRRPVAADLDEFVALERQLNLLYLAVDGLEARGGYSMLAVHRDVTPLVWFMLDISKAVDSLRTRLAAVPLPRRRPTAPPAELGDQDRQP